MTSAGRRRTTGLHLRSRVNGTEPAESAQLGAQKGASLTRLPTRPYSGYDF